MKTLASLIVLSVTLSPMAEPPKRWGAQNTRRQAQPLCPGSEIRGRQAGFVRRLADPQELSAQRDAGSQAGGHSAAALHF